MAMRYLALSATVFAIALLGCDPKAGAVVEAGGDGFRVSVVNCTRPAQGLPVSSITVVRMSPSPQTEPVCSLSRDGSGADLPNGWRYGEPAPGYSLGTCAPLEAGARYEIRTMAAQSPATAVITVGEDGAVTTVRDGCK